MEATSRSSTRSRPSRTRAAAPWARRAADEIAELVQAHGVDVLEDDPYGLVRYEGEAPPALHALEGGDRVTFTSSFSKTAAPGLRVGWFVVPEGMRAAYDDRAVSTYISPPLLPQAIVHELHERGAFEPNLDRIRGILRAQRDAMLAALESELGGRATWSRPEGGYFLWLDFGDGVDAGELLTRATEAGVTFVRGTDFFPGAGRLERRSARVLVRAARADRGRRPRARRPPLAPRLLAAAPPPVRQEPGERGAEQHAQEDQPDEARVDGEEDEADLLLLAVHQQEQHGVDRQGDPEDDLPGDPAAFRRRIPRGEVLAAHAAILGAGVSDRRAVHDGGRCEARVGAVGEARAGRPSQP